MTVTIIPTILASSMRDFNARWKRLTPIADEIQVDLMDGRFVETKSIPLDKVPSVKRYTKRFEAHLMVKEPLSWVAELITKGYRRFIIHHETIMEEDAPLIRRFMEKYGSEAVLALNPDTPVKRIAPIANDFAGVLFLGVHPGKNGAPYVQATPARIREFLRLTRYGKPVQVDGGMTPATVGEVVRAGATRINTGSFVGNAKDPRKALREMQAAAR